MGKPITKDIVSPGPKEDNEGARTVESTVDDKPGTSVPPTRHPPTTLDNPRQPPILGHIHHDGRFGSVEYFLPRMAEQVEEVEVVEEVDDWKMYEWRVEIGWTVRETEDRTVHVRRNNKDGITARLFPLRKRSTGFGYLGVLLWLIAISLLCVPVRCVPAGGVPAGRDTPLASTDFEDEFGEVFEDAYQDTFQDALQEEEEEEEDAARTARNTLDENELEIIRRSIVQGLGLRRIPDSSKANVSQAEYERAHREYLNKVAASRDLRLDQRSTNSRRLHVFQATEYPGNRSTSRNVEPGGGGGGGGGGGYIHRHSLFFPVEVHVDERSGSLGVDHSSLRLLLHGHVDGSVTEEDQELEAVLYMRRPGSRLLIERKSFLIKDPRDSRWLELDSTEAAASWLEAGQENLGLELEFHARGSPITRTFSFPVLNVFTDSESLARRKRSTPEELMSLHKGRRTKCKGESKKCCRHELTVMFKDLKGFEFIVYPKTFDAGYCKGRCPPRYNPAHHHALLQSLLWKEDRKKVPKPCCAPSKLDQLMIVYFDENDSSELKVSYWKNIQVLECACS